MSKQPLSSPEVAIYDRSAKYYLEGRLDYSPALIDHAVRVSRLDKTGTVLDLGCGPGNLANTFAKHAKTVIGIDPSPDMISLATSNAPDNATYHVGVLDDIKIPEKSIRLATFGRSFHWMDRKETLHTLDRLIEPKGCVALLNVNPIYGAGSEHDWYKSVLRALDKSARNKDDTVHKFTKDQMFHWFVLKNSAFNYVRESNYIKWSTWTLPKLQKLALSRFTASQSNLGADEIEKLIKKALVPYGKGPWRTLNSHRIVIASRPGK